MRILGWNFEQFDDHKSAIPAEKTNIFPAEKMDSDFDCDEYDEECESENVADITGAYSKA